MSKRPVPTIWHHIKNEKPFITKNTTTKKRQRHMAGGDGLMRVASRCVKSCHVAGNGKALQDSQRLITLLSALKPSWFPRSTEFIGEFGIRFWFFEYGLSMKGNSCFIALEILSCYSCIYMVLLFNDTGRRQFITSDECCCSSTNRFQFNEVVDCERNQMQLNV